MPIVNGQGYSDATIDKQQGLESFLDMHMRITRHVINRHVWTRKAYYYIDTNAGSGANQEVGEAGSPVIFQRCIRKIGNLDYRAWFIEIRESNVRCLKDLIQESPKDKIVCADNADAIPKIMDQIPPGKKTFGLIYMDANGHPDFGLITRAISRHPSLDILLRVNSTSLKRAKKHLIDEVGKIKKANWIIRELNDSDKWHFTFLYGTNYPGASAFEWAKNGFHSVSSPQGREIMLKCSFSKSDIEAMSGPEKRVITDVKRRSSGLCEICHMRRATEIHHKKGGYGIFSPLMRQHLCHICHCKVEGVDN